VRLLRALLLLASLGGLVFLVYAYSTVSRVTLGERLTIFSIAIALALNFLYLLIVPPLESNKKSRIATLVRLWLDAKEQELRDRVKK